MESRRGVRDCSPFSAWCKSVYKSRVIRSAGSDPVWSSGPRICARSTRSVSSIGHLRVLPPTAGQTGPCRCRHTIDYVVADRTSVYAKC